MVPNINGAKNMIGITVLTNENESFSIESRKSHYLLIGYYIKLVKD